MLKEYLKYLQEKWELGKGGRKKSKVSRRLTKRKDRRKHRKKRKGSKTRRKH